MKSPLKGKGSIFNARLKLGKRKPILGYTKEKFLL
jgi:hypothetical protein